MEEVEDEEVPLGEMMNFDLYAEEEPTTKKMRRGADDEARRR